MQKKNNCAPHRTQNRDNDVQTLSVLSCLQRQQNPLLQVQHKQRYTYFCYIDMKVILDSELLTQNYDMPAILFQLHLPYFLNR